MTTSLMSGSHAMRSAPNPSITCRETLIERGHGPFAVPYASLPVSRQRCDPRTRLWTLAQIATAHDTGNYAAQISTSIVDLCLGMLGADGQTGSPPIIHIVGRTRVPSVQRRSRSILFYRRPLWLCDGMQILPPRVCWVNPPWAGLDAEASWVEVFVFAYF